jgi:hypothetical protein
LGKEIVTTDLLHQYDARGEGYLSHCHGDETWVHHFEPESKQWLIEWCRVMSQRMNNVRSTLSAGNHGYSFWNEKDFLLKKLLLRGEAIFITMLKE